MSMDKCAVASYSSADDLIERLNLQPHPTENGYMTKLDRHFNASKKIQQDDHELPTANLVQFLYKKGTFAPWHRMKQTDLFWIHQGGAAVTVHMICEHGEYCCRQLSINGTLHIPTDHWFTAIPAGTHEYALFGVVTTPGFHPNNCEMASSDILESTNIDVDLKEHLMRYLPKTEADSENTRALSD